ASGVRAGQPRHVEARRRQRSDKNRREGIDAGRDVLGVDERRRGTRRLEQGGAKGVRAAFGGGESMVSRKPRLSVVGQRGEVNRARVACLDVSEPVLGGDGKRERRARGDGFWGRENEFAQRGRDDRKRSGRGRHTDADYGK